MEYTIFSVSIFFFGLIMGSFLNCLIYRLALPSFSFWKNLGGLSGRSYCPHCKHVLIWKDLIPVFSFLSLRGKCRYCAKKISWQYPLVEIATGVVFLLIYLAMRNLAQPDNLINVIFLFYITSALIVIFVYDLKHYIIPDKILFPAILITFLYQLIFSYKLSSSLTAGISVTSGGPSFFNYLLSAFGAFAFFGFMFFISQGRWMGFGDCKLAILLGLFLGFPNIILGIFLSFFLGAIIGVELMILDKKGLKSQIPFAPFLITGTFITIFWGQELINWYTTHLLLF